MAQRPRINPSDLWRLNHPWAPLYAFALAHPPLAKTGGRLMMNTDMGLLYDAIAELGQVPDGSAVLDVPCGGGVALRGLRPEQDIRYVAADIAEPMLARTANEARRLKLAQIDLVQADVGNLPFADGEFDVCVTFTGLHCFPDPHAAVLELGRVVKAGGRISGSFVTTDAGARYRPMRVVGRATGLMGPSAALPEARSWLTEAGFTDLTAKRSGPLAYFTAVKA